MQNESSLHQCKKTTLFHVIVTSSFYCITSHKDGDVSAQNWCYWLVTSGTYFCDFIDTEKRCVGRGGGSMLFRYHDIDLKLFFYKKSFQLWKCRERNLLTLQNVLFKNKNLTCIFFCTPLRGWINCFSFFSFCSFKVFNLGAGPYRKACPCVFVAARKTLQRVWGLSTETQLISISVKRNGEYNLPERWFSSFKN